MNKLLPLVLALTLFFAASFARTGEATAPGGVKTIVLPPEEVDLKPGAGLDKVQLNCLICHSADYIKMQPKFTKTQWTAAVTKMIKVFGAQISAEDINIISDYLALNYGAGS